MDEKGGAVVLGHKELGVHEQQRAKQLPVAYLLSPCNPLSTSGDGTDRVWVVVKHS